MSKLVISIPVCVTSSEAWIMIPIVMFRKSGKREWSSTGYDDHSSVRTSVFEFWELGICPAYFLRHTCSSLTKTKALGLYSAITQVWNSRKSSIDRFLCYLKFCYFNKSSRELRLLVSHLWTFIRLRRLHFSIEQRFIFSLSIPFDKTLRSQNVWKR